MRALEDTRRDRMRGSLILSTESLRVLSICLQALDVSKYIYIAPLCFKKVRHASSGSFVFLQLAENSKTDYPPAVATPDTSNTAAVSKPCDGATRNTTKGASHAPTATAALTLRSALNTSTLARTRLEGKFEFISLCC